jgi:hypothetical protein
LVGVLVDFFIGRRQTNSSNSPGKNNRCVQCYNGDVIGLTQIKINQSDVKNKTKKQHSRSIATTYMGEGIEFAVKDNFADPSRHLDVGYPRPHITGHPSRYGHARHLIQRHSAHARKRRGNK